VGASPSRRPLQPETDALGCVHFQFGVSSPSDGLKSVPIRSRYGTNAPIPEVPERCHGFAFAGCRCPLQKGYFWKLRRD
jgi:hypothetical protein